MRTARSIAAQAAVAIANAHIHARGEDLAKRLTALASWAARLAAAGSPEQARARTTRAAGLLLDAPLVAHWSPGVATWYPAPPVIGVDYEQALAQPRAHGRSLPSDRQRIIAAELAAAFAARGLAHAALSVATDRRSMILVGRTSGVSGIDAQVASLLTDLADSALRTAEAHQKVAHLALTDPLTDVGNRRAFEARLTEGLALTARTGQPLSLCLVDLDDFRSFNETGGHQQGDEALRLVAGALRDEMRTSDLAFRVGGDEFALVLPDTVATSGAALLERVRVALAGTHLGPLSITAGVAQAPADGGDLATLYAAADEALYAGKRAGRGRVVIARERPDPVRAEFECFTGEPLEQHVVLPLAGDAQVLGRDADPGEAVALQNPLRGQVVDQGAGFEPMQLGLAERPVTHLRHRLGRDAAPVVRLGDEIADGRALEHAAHDVVDREHARPARRRHRIRNRSAKPAVRSATMRSRIRA